MEVRARVREVEGGLARLVCDPEGQCGLCGSGARCGAAMRGSAGGAPLSVPCDLHAAARALAAGDRVVLSVADGVIVRAAAFHYLLPVAGLLGGAGLSRAFGMGDGPAFLVALLGALAGVACGRRAAARFRTIPAWREAGSLDG
jgi:sigma-E factor negative regulatory protein RseC